MQPSTECSKVEDVPRVISTVRRRLCVPPDAGLKVPQTAVLEKKTLIPRVLVQGSAGVGALER